MHLIEQLFAIFVLLKQIFSRLIVCVFFNFFRNINTWLALLVGWISYQKILNIETAFRGFMREPSHIMCLWAVVMVKMVDEVSVVRLDFVLYWMYYCQCHHYLRRQLFALFHLYDVWALMVSFLRLSPVKIEQNNTYFSQKGFYIFYSLFW